MAKANIPETGSVAKDDYVPYGPEWENEVMKLPKKMVIKILREKILELTKELENAKAS
jgi:hypothetical protein